MCYQNIHMLGWQVVNVLIVVVVVEPNTAAVRALGWLIFTDDCAVFSIRCFTRALVMRFCCHLTDICLYIKACRDIEIFWHLALFPWPCINRWRPHWLQLVYIPICWWVFDQTRANTVWFGSFFSKTVFFPCTEPPFMTLKNQSCNDITQLLAGIPKQCFFWNNIQNVTILVDILIYSQP